MNQIDRLLTVMQRLRDPENGCPWDKEQKALPREAHLVPCLLTST